MQVIREYVDFDDLIANSWSGALDTLEDIRNANLEPEFMDYLEMVFSGDEMPPTETEVNDYIWFERDSIYSDLGLDENGKTKGEDTEEEEELEEANLYSGITSNLKEE